jgi:hypothetical protein
MMVCDLTQRIENPEVSGAFRLIGIDEVTG